MLFRVDSRTSNSYISLSWIGVDIIEEVVVEVISDVFNVDDISIDWTELELVKELIAVDDKTDWNTVFEIAVRDK